MNLVFHQAALGDFALILPMLRGLGGPTTLLTQWSRGRLAEALVDDLRAMDIEMFEFSRLHSDAGPSTLSPAVGELFEAATRVIGFVADVDSPWAANVARLAPKATLACIAPRPPEDFGDHVTRWHQRQAARAGIVYEPIAPPARSSAEGPLVIHPGSGGEGKCWPRERFEAVIHRLRAAGRPVRVLLGEAEVERWPRAELQRWQAELGAQVCLVLEPLLEALMDAGGYVGNDAGPTHIAAQLGLPTLALFGPSDPALWVPPGEAADILAPPTPAAMDWLTVDAVCEALGA